MALTGHERSAVRSDAALASSGSTGSATPSSSSLKPPGASWTQVPDPMQESRSTVTFTAGIRTVPQARPTRPGF